MNVGEPSDNAGNSIESINEKDKEEEDEDDNENENENENEA